MLKEFEHQFPLIITIIFATYFIWDLLKHIEYPDEGDRRNTKKRSVITLRWLLLAVVLTLAYWSYGIVQPPMSDMIDREQWTLTFIFLVFALVVGYRAVKWRVDERSPSYDKNRHE
ncbi:hypothetical protein CENSYa_0752 [Cenarchaeum symbiosum A]|uniref:Uncharacterized protein n=1 Tax=Cenarchaeum symbiosum (strain A) TaxID=414004 RepID=A0RVL8_CENSY|nr:hypothetical protein CENSYa_0752 [Cenarchaeum symbiosum A]